MFSSFKKTITLVLLIIQFIVSVFLLYLSQNIQINTDIDINITLPSEVNFDSFKNKLGEIGANIDRYAIEGLSPEVSSFLELDVEDSSTGFEVSLPADATSSQVESLGEILRSNNIVVSDDSATIFKILDIRQNLFFVGAFLFIASLFGIVSYMAISIISKPTNS